jgi:hypothetical protein
MEELKRLDTGISRRRGETNLENARKLLITEGTRHGG